LVILLAFSFCFYLLSGLVFAAESGAENRAYKVVTVQKGDSLWDLAVRYHEQAGMDVRECVDTLIEINGLDDVTIYPGQNLNIPVQS
jgi:LysM repeat protein